MKVYIRIGKNMVLQLKDRSSTYIIVWSGIINVSAISF